MQNSQKNTCVRQLSLQIISGRLLLKCGHCKNEAREIDCLCCREVDAMLIASDTIPEPEGSISPCGFYGHLPDYWSHVSALSTKYMSSFLGSWCSWRKQGGWVNLRFYLFVSAVNHTEWEREVSPRFSFVTSGFWGLLLGSTACKVAWFSVCGVFVDD